MRIAFASAGTEGDVQPLLAIGRGLKARGHAIQFGSAPPYRALVEQAGFEPLPIGNYDPKAVTIDYARKNPKNSRLVTLRRRLTPGKPNDEMLGDFARVCQGADAVVYTPIASYAYHPAEALDLPVFEVQLVPMAPTRAFPSPHAPVPASAGPVTRYLSHFGVSQLSWMVNRGWLNDWRRQLGLPALSIVGPPATAFYRRRRRVLCAVSPSVVPRPVDWPAANEITGYLFPSSEDFAPSPELVAFLEAGPAPVCVTFGSSVEADPKSLRPILEAAQKLTGKRFVLVKGWANYEVPAPTADFFVLDRASYPWLYARSCAVVHHVGTGTAAEAVRAGVPSICVPRITEQRFWADRLFALGVSPVPILRDRLTAEGLAGAIERACEPAMQARARQLGVAVRAEDGLAVAVERIERAGRRKDDASAA